MKSRREIWFAMLTEVGIACSVSTALDRKYVERRLAAEGDSFFTTTLPAFEKAFTRAIDEGKIRHHAFPGFSRNRRNSPEGYVKGVPKFLGGFLDLLFTSEVYSTGPQGERIVSILPEPVLRFKDPTEVDPRVVMAVKGIRQICLMFSKEKSLCDQSKIDQAVEDYVSVDKDVILPLMDSRANLLFEGGYLGNLRRVIRVVFGDVLSAVDKEIYDGGALVPKHGPGATADKLRGNDKWKMPSWHDRLEFLFPYREYALPNWRFAREEQEITFLSPQDELPVNLTAVPKTQTTPRLIAIEPTVMQYIQQAIMGSLVPKLESHPVAGSFVAYTDQRPNQELARVGSLDGSYATLDLSEASDRVANWLVEDAFSDFPYFLEGIQACRSTRCRLPSGQVIPVMKFASMGSALTFPIESMLFSAMAILGCLSLSGTRPSSSAIMQYTGHVRVYGDDIIVPVDAAESVVDTLEIFGSKVNRHKSFWTGPFRESCGKEYFFGHDVTVVRVREKFPSSRNSVKELVSLSALRNLLCNAGWLDTVSLLDEELLTLLKGKYPYVSENSMIIGRVGPEPPEKHRWNLRLFRFEVHGYIMKADIPMSILNDIPALTKCLMHPGISADDTKHLTRSGRPRVASLKLGWAPVD